MSVQQAASLSRDELESGLDMLALLLFRNELKPDTAEAVQHLKQGQVSAAVPCRTLHLRFEHEHIPLGCFYQSCDTSDQYLHDVINIDSIRLEQPVPQGNCPVLCAFLCCHGSHKPMLYIVQYQLPGAVKAPGAGLAQCDLAIALLWWGCRCGPSW